MSIDVEELLIVRHLREELKNLKTENEVLRANIIKLHDAIDAKDRLINRLLILVEIDRKEYYEYEI